MRRLQRRRLYAICWVLLMLVQQEDPEKVLAAADAESKIKRSKVSLVKMIREVNGELAEAQKEILVLRNELDNSREENDTLRRRFEALQRQVLADAESSQGKAPAAKEAALPSAVVLAKQPLPQSKSSACAVM